jgi:hypothetical protein
MVMWASGGGPDVAGLAATDPELAGAEPAGEVFAGEVLAGVVPADPVLANPVRGGAVAPVTTLPQPASSPARMTPTAAERQVSRIVRG